MSDETQILLNRLAKLKVDRARGDPAPHKPLLLLSVMDLIESGAISTATFALSVELTFQSLTFWRIVAHRRAAAPDVRFPFHHLSGDGIWSVLDSKLQPSVDRKLTRFAHFDDAAFNAFSDPAFRHEVRRILIVTYFLPEELIALAATLAIPEVELGAAATAIAAREHDIAQQKGREVKFRLVVVAAYSFTCCLTRHRLTTISRGSMIDAAHIHQFADSRNNDPRNGIALSKNAHWMFDIGLWTIADDFTIKVDSGQFVEDHPNGKTLSQFEGQQILLPADAALRPAPAYLEWHRSNKFTGAFDEE